MTDARRYAETGSQADPITIILCDDHPAYRAGLKEILEEEQDLRVVAQASDGAEALRLTITHKPSVVLMDLKMDGVGGVEATERIKAAVPETQVLVVTTDKTSVDVLSATRAGATGYVLKVDPNEEIRRAVRDAAAGLSPISRRAAGHLINAVRQPANAPLTVDEIEVIQLVARGQTNDAIDRARAGRTPRRRAQDVLRSINHKMGTQDRAHAVYEAMRRGYIS